MAITRRKGNPLRQLSDAPEKPLGPQGATQDLPGASMLQPPSQVSRPPLVKTLPHDEGGNLPDVPGTGYSPRENFPGDAATPTRPSGPSPVSMETPQPFQPMPPAMSTQQSARPMSSGYGPASGSSLLGRAGGLLGGGLGVPGIAKGGMDISALIESLLRLRGR